VTNWDDMEKIWHHTFYQTFPSTMNQQFSGIKPFAGSLPFSGGDDKQHNAKKSQTLQLYINQ
jgi:actin-related protein